MESNNGKEKERQTWLSNCVDGNLIYDNTKPENNTIQPMVYSIHIDCRNLYFNHGFSKE